MLKTIAVLVIASSLCGCGTFMQKGALSSAYRNYDKRDYEDTLSLVSQAESYASPAPELKAEMVFLKALALEKLEREDEAQGSLNYLVEQFPETEYGYRAKVKLKEIADCE